MKQKLIIFSIIIIFILIAKKSKAMSKAKTTPLDFSKIKLLPTQVMRNDVQGEGKYGATRNGHTHQGIDLIAKVDEKITLNMPGVVTKIGYAYANDQRFNSYHIELVNGMILKLLYVKPLFKVGNKIQTNEVIATAQDIAGKWKGGMINHIHVELLENGKQINPTNYFL